MEYEEIKLLKQSEKSTIHLVREKNREQVYVRKLLKGQHPIYHMLQDCPHPGLPKIYEVIVEDDSTTIIEEYIEGQSSGAVKLSGVQIRSVVKELCCTLEFLHGKGIIHRDIKPSNIILTGAGHAYLIDFDAARMPKEDLDQDTRLLGTRGFAPPEQYGFSQTDERADIYALGVTLSQLLGEKARKPYYRRIIRKCTNLDPEKRYQSVLQVRRAFFHTGRDVLCALAVFFVLILLVYCAVRLSAQQEERVDNSSGDSELVVLPAPENPHWDGETGIAVWGNVLESGIEDEVQFHWRLYRKDIENSPNPDDDDWVTEGDMRGNGPVVEGEYISYPLTIDLGKNGIYYFSVSAVGNGIHYADSPYVVSDAFEYTGEDAPPLPVPTGLEWRVYDINDRWQYYATWSNLDDYGDKDWFDVTVYDKTGAYVMNNTWSKQTIMERGFGGIRVYSEFLVAKPDYGFRFTVQVYSSRPNEFQSSPMPDPVPEEYFSPWLYR